MRQLSWEYKMALVFLAISLILGVLLGVEWWYGRQFRESIMRDIFKVSLSGFEMEAIPEYPFLLQPVESYAQFIDRPIFFESRKPVPKVTEQPAATPTPAPEPPKPPPEFNLVLSGVLNTPNGIQAIFLNPQATSYAEKHKKLSKGDEVIPGWKLIAIKSDKVVVQADIDKQTKDILLLKAKNKHPIPVPGQVPPQNINPFNIQPPQPPR